MQLHLSTTRWLCLTLLALKAAYCTDTAPDVAAKATDDADSSREKRGVLLSDAKDDALSKYIDTLATPEDDADLTKRGWKSMNAWGKRKMYNLTPWGKRRWARLQSWGKRSLDTPEQDAQNEEPFNSDMLNDADDKRGWKQMATWGKRDMSDPSAADGLDDVDKRKWSGFASWGKRDDENLSDLLAKRKWTQLSAWGKRAGDLTEDEVEAIKRKWSSMASWGKRANWKGFNAWGKRNPWAGLSTWGKRSKWSGFNSWGKRDGVESPEQ